MDAGLYGPGSAAWRVARERVLLLCGPRALLMQLAHPLVARGVDEHSDFRERPFRRLARTLTVTYDAIFGSTATALDAVRRVNDAHARVRGPGYSAMDPHLLLWVLATLVDSALLGYEFFVAPLEEAERDAYYGELRRWGDLLGIPRATMPASVRELRSYIETTIATGEARVDDIGRAAARDTLWPPNWRYAPRPVFDLVALLTAGLLPPALREQYRLPWSRRHRAAFELSVRVVRVLVPLLPPALRWVPQARAAYRRVAA